jgi:MFS family permease
LELTRHTFQIAVLASIIPAFLAVIVLVVGVKEVGTNPKARRSNNSDKKTVKHSSPPFDKRFKYFLFVTVLFTLGNSSDSFIVLRGQERGLNILQIMGMLMSFTLVYFVLSGPFGSLSDRIGRRSLILAGWLAYGLVYLGLAFAAAGWQVWILFALYGVYYAATEGVSRALVADLVPEARRGTAYGLFNAAIGLAALPASLIAGILWQGVGAWTGFGAAAPFYFGSALSLLAGVLFWRLV